MPHSNSTFHYYLGSSSLLCYFVRAYRLIICFVLIDHICAFRTNLCLSLVLELPLFHGITQKRTNSCAFRT